MGLCEIRGVQKYGVFNVFTCQVKHLRFKLTVLYKEEPEINQFKLGCGVCICVRGPFVYSIC